MATKTHWQKAALLENSALKKTSLFIGLRYLLSRKHNRSVSFISALAITGIVLGVALLIIVLSVMNGFDRELQQRILGVMPHVTLYERGGMGEWKPLRDEILPLESVNGVAPFIELQGLLNKRKQTKPVLVYGVDSRFEETVSDITRYLTADVLVQLDQNNDTIALGKDLADQLLVEVGERLTLLIPRNSRAARTPVIKQLKIIDIFSTGTELDQKFALMGLSGAANLSPQSQRITGLHIRTDDLFNAPQIASQIRQTAGQSFYTRTWVQTHGNIYYAIQMSKNLVSLLLFLIIAIAAFNLVSTLVMVVVDKQKDIAILRTLGLSTTEIRHVFMIQGAFIGLIGTIIGVAFGVIFSLFLESAIAQLQSILGVRFLQTDIYPISFIPSELSISSVGFIAVISIVMCVIATIYPASRAAKVQPADALRFDE